MSLKEQFELLDKEGLKGFNEAVKESRGLDKIIWDILQRSLGVRTLIKYLTDVTSDPENKDVHTIAQDFLHLLGVEINSEELPAWMSETGKPVLFYSNHDVKIEPIILTALFEREDFAFLGLANNMATKLQDIFRDHIIPVMPRKYAVDSPRTVSFVERLLMTNHEVTLAEAAEINDRSLQESAQRLLEGEAVGIFPAGSRSEQDEWFPGIGKIITEVKDLKEKNPTINESKDILLAPINFSGFSGLQLLKALRSTYSKYRFPTQKQVDIQFGKPLSLNEMTELGNDSKRLTSLLQSHYLTQFLLND